MPNPYHRILILGHSGVGKSNISDFFNLEICTPFRVRDKGPRDENDRAISIEEFKIMPFYEHVNQFFNKKDNNETPNYTIFRKNEEDYFVCRVRGKYQYETLPNLGANKKKPILIELYGPIIAEMSKEDFEKIFGCNIKDFFVIFLNPCNTSITDMESPSFELKMATAQANMEREKIQWIKKGVLQYHPNLSKIIKRVESLAEELKSWKEIKGNLEENFVEILNWPYFEYEFLIRPNQTILEAYKMVKKNIKEIDLDKHLI